MANLLTTQDRDVMVDLTRNVGRLCIKALWTEPDFNSAALGAQQRPHGDSQGQAAGVLPCSRSVQPRHEHMLSREPGSMGLYTA